MENVKNDLRSSNIELLRIIAMISILLCHFNSNVENVVEQMQDTMMFWVYTATMGWTGAVGNSFFMLISGYFLCLSDFKIKKFLQIWFQIFSTSVFVCLIFYIFKIPSQDPNAVISSEWTFFQTAKIIGLKEIGKSFIPTILGNSWYATKYLVFLLLTPFLKKTLEVFDRSKLFKLITLLFVFGTVTKMIPAQRLWDPSNMFYFILAYYGGGVFETL